MISVKPVQIDDATFIATKVALPKTNLLIVSNEVGYIMCAALDVDILDTALKDRHVIAGRARGVRSIEDLLNAPLEQVTEASQASYGWKEGMIGKEALLKIAIDS